MRIFGGLNPDGSERPVEETKADDDIVVAVTWAEPDVAKVIQFVDDLMSEWRGQSLLDQVRAIDALLDIRDLLTKEGE